MADLTFLDSTTSTNDVLLARAAQGAPEFTVVTTTNQTAGRGRLGREWIAPPGQALAASVLLRPRQPGGELLGLPSWGWIPLIAGVAMTRAVRTLLSVRNFPANAIPSKDIPYRDAWLKWPNDVLVGGRKISGILAEILPSGDGLVLGAGLNLTIPASALPTPTSTSLGIEGVELAGSDLVDAALSCWLQEFRSLYAGFVQHSGDEERSGVREQVIGLCSTLGQHVRVQLPGGGELLGTAIDVDSSGRLRIRRKAETKVQTVAAGDVTHLRYE